MLPLEESAHALGDVEDFRKRLFHSSQIVGVDLDAIASLTGHGDPQQMTAQHYCHTLFMVVESFLATDPRLVIPKRTLVMASGLPKTTAYRLASEGANQLPAYLFETRFRRELEEISRQKKQSQSTVAPPQSLMRYPLSRALCCASALVDSAQSLDRICASTGLSLPVVNRIGTILEQQLPGKLNDSESGGTNALLLSVRNQEIFTQTSLKLAAMYAAKQNQTEQSLAILADSYWSGLECCLFRGTRSVPPAKRFICLLRQLDVQEDHIRLILFGAEDHERAKKLKLRLGVPHANVVFRRPTNSTSKASSAWIGIQPLFDQAGKHGVVPKASSAFWAVGKFANSILQDANGTFSEPGQAAQSAGGDRG